MSDNNSWREHNKRYLAIKIKEIGQKLEKHLYSDKNNNNNEKATSDNTGLHIRRNDKNKIAQASFGDVFVTDGDKKEVQYDAFKNLSKDTVYHSAKTHNFVPAIELLSRAFKLSEFEKNMILLCAAVELDSHTSKYCSKIHHDGVGNNVAGAMYPTFALGFAIFSENSHWSAILPTSPLRRYQLLKLFNSQHQLAGPLVFLPLMINEQVLHYLLGLAYSETDLSGIIQRPSRLNSLEIEKITSNKSLQYYKCNLPHLLELCEANTDKISKGKNFKDNHQNGAHQNPIPAIIFSNGDEIDELLLAQEVCTKLDLHLRYLDAENIPTRNEDLQQLTQSWTRDAMLLGMGLFISYKDLSGDSQNQILQSLKIFIENIPAPIFVHTVRNSQLLDLSRPYNVVNLKKPSKAEQIHIWGIFLESLFKTCRVQSGIEKNLIIKKLINQFDFTSSEIFQVCKGGTDEKLLQRNKEGLYESLWEKSLDVSKPRVGNLGILIPSSSSASSFMASPTRSDSPSSSRLSLDDIVLPQSEKELLKIILMHYQHRDKVYREWGFEEKNRSRGLGITVLFVGQSGTGKTMAAEILASALNLNLLRVDLSQVVSKYIGETEKNLDKIFESTSKGGCVLHCDEADALFGKRIELKDSLDRYANIETSFLLQRMESYNGLVILSTNMFKALDNAFLRRISFKVNFELPDEECRCQIWKKTFPKDTPLASIDFESLAKLKITGGNIHSICLNASFFAAHDNVPVNKTHINKALQIEYSKMGRSLNDATFFP